MITAGVQSGSQGNQVKNKAAGLKAEDFIKMMVTQLQNQDPLEPAKNQELLAQMSQIGQLQSSTSLQETLKSIMLQNSLGSAGNLIGKAVAGLDANNESIGGIVISVRVENDQVHLELDNGQSLALARVTSIAGSPVTTAAAGS